MKVRIVDNSYETDSTRRFNFKIPKRLTLKDFIDDLLSYILDVKNKRIRNYLKDYVDKGYFDPEEWKDTSVESNIDFIYELIEYTGYDNVTDFVENMSKKYQPYNPISSDDYDVLILTTDFSLRDWYELIPPDEYEKYENEFKPPMIVIGDKLMIEYIFEKTKEFNDQMVKFLFEYYCNKIN